MNSLRRLAAGFRALFLRRKLESELEAELRSHLELRTEANLAAGMDAREARLAALRQFGGTDQVKEQCRDQRGARWMENFLHDIRFGARQLRKNPGFSMVAALTLALGIGANAFVFSVLNRVYLEPLPFDEPDQLVRIAILGRARDYQKVSFPEFDFLRAHSATLHFVSAVQARGVNLTGVEEPASLQASLVSAGFFEALGVRPVLGRTFDSSEYERGADHEVVLGYWVWQRHFSGARNVLDRVIELNREAYRIVGVLPPNFSVPVEAGNSEIWMPMALSQADLRNDQQNVSVIGRLTAGQTIGRAQAEARLLDGRFRELRRVSPDLGPLHAAILTHQVDRGTSLFVGMLSLAVVFVLLIGCANVAGLSLSRSLARRKEIAVRFSLGATRWRVLQQLLFEGVILGLLGGVLGVFLAFYGARFAALWVGEPARFDARVVLFSGAASLLAGAVCGWLPAMLASRVSLGECLKDMGQAQGGSVRTFRLRQLFVVAQVAMSLTLLLGTGLIVRSLVKLALTDPGFNPKGLLSVQVYLPTEAYKTDNARTAFFERTFQQLESLPGARAVGGTSSFPIYAPTFFRPFRIVGREGALPDASSEADINRITSSYLPLMGIPLVEGRYFTDADRGGSEGVAIIDETFKRRFLRDRPAIGSVLSVEAEAGARKTFTIVGVARNVINVGNQYELGRPRPIVYVPFGQFAPTTMTLLVRTEGLPDSVRPALRRLLRSADPDLPVRDIRPVEDRIREAGNRSRQMLGVLGVFAGSALVLCAIGVFGVVALSVAQRTREIGIRIALGAPPGKVQLLFLRQGLVLTASGIGLGVLGALALTRQIESLLYGISPNDLLTYLGAALVVAAVALGATYLPSRRAALVDPALALRSE